MKIGWTTFFVFFYLYRLSISIAAELIVRKITPLGDAAKYQKDSATLTALSVNESTGATRLIGSIFHKLSFGNPFGVNIMFMTVAFVGIVIFLRSLEPDVRKFAAAICLLPSFNLWSSVASKESIIILGVALCCAMIADLVYNRARFRWYYFLGVFIVAFWKPHYGPAFLFVVLILLLGRHVRQKNLVALIAFFASLSFLYVFRDRIDQLAFSIPEHFIGAGGSTRDVFWINQYDVFWKAPYGMMQSFLGPTISEALGGHLLHKFSFIESMIILFIFALMIIPRIKDMPLFGFFVTISGLFWILFTNYPFGIMNPGSAIRYRTGYILFVVLIFALLLSRDVYSRWHKGWQTRSDGSVAA